MDEKIVRIYLSLWITDEGELYYEESNHHRFVHDHDLYGGIRRDNVFCTVYIAHYNDVDDRLTKELCQTVARNYLDKDYKRHHIDLREW